MIIPWWITALFFSIGMSGYILVNQQFKLPAHVLAMWRGFGVGAAMLPFVLLTSPPTSWKFYVFVFINGILSGYYDNRVFTGSSKFGGGVISRVRSLSVIFSSIFWWGINPNQFIELTKRPWILTGILTCLFGCILAVFFIKKDKISRKALILFFPAVIAAGFIGTFNKSAMIEAPIYQALIYYLFLVSIINGTVNLLVYYKNKHQYTNSEKIFSKKSVTGGIIIVLFMCLLMSSRNYSMAYVPNPAYVSAIGYSSVVWILIFNKIKGIKDDANIWAGMIFVVSAVFLILLTAY